VLAKLHPEWDVGDAGTTGSAQFSREYHAALDGPADVARNDGNVDEALLKAAKTLEAVYETPYLAPRADGADERDGTLPARPA
jgi:isoquinoline 1-oxidoreductase beta subunit